MFPAGHLGGVYMAGCVYNIYSSVEIRSDNQFDSYLYTGALFGCLFWNYTK